MLIVTMLEGKGSKLVTPHRRLQIITLLIILGFVATAGAGWIMVEKEGDISIISKGKLKSSAEGLTWILDGPGNKMIFIDNNQHSFAAGTVEDYCDATTAIIREAMEGLTTEQRKVLEEMMKKNQGDSGHEVSISKAGEGGIVAGLKTSKFRIQVDGELYKDIWLATDAGLLREYKPLIPLLQKFSSCANTFGTDFIPENTSEYLRLMEQGVEVKSVIYTTDRPEPVTEMIKMEKKSLPETDFSIPPAYRQMSFGQMLRSQME
jgi:hypothetical protein